MHRFELVIRDALRPHLQGGECAGILLNRRLGNESATEADLLYAGTREGRSVAVIVECKNRPITVSGSRIELAGRDSEARKDLMAQLDLQAHHARVFLGFEDIKFIVVGCTKISFSERVTSDIFAVGQPIAKWTGSTSEQDFSLLISTWLEAVKGIKALRLDSVDYAKLRDLPKYAPWNTVEAEDLRKDLEIESMLSEMEELMGVNELGYAERLRRFVRDREQDRYLDDG